PALHYLERHIVSNRVSHDDRDTHLAAKFFEIERPVLRRNVTDRGNRALYHENVRASFLGDFSKFRCALRNGTHRCCDTGVLDLAHARRNEILLNGFLVNSLQEGSNLRFTCVDDFLQDLLRVLVARLHAFQVQNGKSTEFAHRDGEADIDDPIHRAGEDRDLQLKRFRRFARQTKRDVHFVRVDRHAPRHKRDLVETISHARLPVSTYPQSHAKGSPSGIGRVTFRSVGTGDAAHPYDPQIRTRKSRNATGAEETVALAAGGSILPLSRIERLPQEKAADKS